MMTIRMGCFFETSLTINYASGHQGSVGGVEEGAQVKDYTFNGNSFKIILPKQVSLDFTYLIGSSFNWQSGRGDPRCNMKKLSICRDSPNLIQQGKVCNEQAIKLIDTNAGQTLSSCSTACDNIIACKMFALESASCELYNANDCTFSSGTKDFYLPFNPNGDCQWIPSLPGYVFSFTGGNPDTTNLISAFVDNFYYSDTCYAKCAAEPTCVNFLLNVSSGHCSLYSIIKPSDGNYEWQSYLKASSKCMPSPVSSTDSAIISSCAARATQTLCNPSNPNLYQVKFLSSECSDLATSQIGVFIDSQTVDQCSQNCIDTVGCTNFVLAKSSSSNPGRCFLYSKCDSLVSNVDYDVYSSVPCFAPVNSISLTDSEKFDSDSPSPTITITRSAQFIETVWLKAEIPHANIYHYLKGQISVCGAPISLVSAAVYSLNIDITDHPTYEINLIPITPTSLPTFFQGQTLDCPISSFELLDSGTNTVFSNNGNGFAINAVKGSLEITYPDVQDFTFDIKAQILNVDPITKMMDIKIGCFTQTGLVGNFVDASAFLNYDTYTLSSSSPTQIKLVVAKQTPDFEYQLNVAINWVTDKNHPKCGLKKLSICDDNSSVANVPCTAPILTSAPQAITLKDATLTLQTNIVSITSTTIDPYLVIKRDIPTLDEGMTVWFKAEIPQSSLYHYVKMNLVICGRPISLVDAAIFQKDIDITFNNYETVGHNIDILTPVATSEVYYGTNTPISGFFTGLTIDCPVKQFNLKNTGTNDVFDVLTPGTAQDGFSIPSTILVITYQQVQDFTFDIQSMIPLVADVSKIMKIRIGCFIQTGLNGSFITSKAETVINDYILTSSSPTQFKLVVAKQTPDFNLQLNTAINWVTALNHPKCGLKKLSICDDNSSVANVPCTAPIQPTAQSITLKESALTLQTNIVSITSTTIDPYLVINRQFTTPDIGMTVWFKAEIPQSSIFHYFEMNLIICGKPITLTSFEDIQLKISQANADITTQALASVQDKTKSYSPISNIALQQPGRKTWQESYDYAISLGSRLPTLVEAQAYITKKATTGMIEVESYQQLITTGDTNIYVPVGDPSSKDWMMIGKDGAIEPGTSIISLGAYPLWGDDATQELQMQYMLIKGNSVGLVQEIDVIDYITKGDSSGETRNLNLYFDGETVDCPIQTFELFDISSVALNEPLMNIDIVTNILTISIVDDVRDIVFDIKATIPNIVIPKKRMTIKMGCFKDTFIKGTFERPIAFNFIDQVLFEERSADYFSLILGRNSDTYNLISLHYTKKLNDLYDWTTGRNAVPAEANNNKCMLKKLTLCIDQNYPCTPYPNPNADIQLLSSESLDETWLDPQIEVKRETGFIQPVYLLAEIPQSQVRSFLPGQIVVCGLETINNDATQDQAVFNIDTTIINGKVLEFDLKHLWFVDTTTNYGATVLPENCPIMQYLICSDQACSQVIADSWKDRSSDPDPALSIYSFINRDELTPPQLARPIFDTLRIKTQQYTDVTYWLGVKTTGQKLRVVEQTKIFICNDGYTYVDGKPTIFNLQIETPGTEIIEVDITGVLPTRRAIGFYKNHYFKDLQIFQEEATLSYDYFSIDHQSYLDKGVTPVPKDLTTLIPNKHEIGCPIKSFNLQNFVGTIEEDRDVELIQPFELESTEFKFSRDRLQKMTFDLVAKTVGTQVIKKFDITVGCYNSKNVTAKYLKPSDIRFKTEIPSPFFFKIVLPKSLIAQDSIFDLNSVIEWIVDHTAYANHCHIKSLTISTIKYTVSNSQYISLQMNPLAPPLTALNDRIVPVMTVKTTQQFNQRIYLTGSMPLSYFKAADQVEGLVIVCGQETLNDFKRTHELMNYQGYFNDIQNKTFDFGSFWKVESSNPDVLPSDCPIKPDGYQLCELIGSSALKECIPLEDEIIAGTTETYERYKITGSKLFIDFSKPLKHREFYLQVSTIGEVKASIKLKINICGYEKIEIKQAEYIFKLRQSYNILKYDMKKEFVNNEAACPIKNYTLLDMYEYPMSIAKQLQMINLKADLMKIKPSIPLVFRFIVQAITESGVVNKYIMDMDIEVDPTLKPYEIAANDAPKFPNLIKKHSVDIIIDLVGQMQDKESYFYRSERAFDEQGDNFDLIIKGDYRYIKTKYENLQFNLEIVKAEMNEFTPKKTIIELQLVDEWNFQSEIYKIEISMNYTDLRIIEAARIAEEERIIKIKQSEEEAQRLMAKKNSKPLSEQSEAELLNSVGLPFFKEDSEMTDEELINEVFQGKELCDEHLEHEHGGFNPEEEKVVDDTVIQQLAAQCALKKAENAEKNKKMRAEGFKRTRVGYTWPTVNITNIEEQLRLNLLITQNNVKVKDKKSPKMYVAPINGNGTIEMSFNHLMLYPIGKMDPKIYNEVFGLSIQAKQDLSFFYGDFTTFKAQNQSSNQAKRQLQDDEDDSFLSESEKMRFHPTITIHKNNKISIDIGFEDKKKMSVAGQGTMFLTIKQPEIFKSMTTFEEITVDSFDNGITTFEYTLPPIDDDPEATARLAQASEDAGNFMEGASQGNMLVSLLLQGSTQSLFGMIRAMQVITLSALVECSMPNILFVFLQSAISFAQMDILNGERMYEESFSFKETEPINDQFAFFGIGDKNFLNNNGSYGLILCGLTWSTFGYYCLNKMAAKCFKYKISRLIGQWAYRREYSTLLSGAVYKLILETYFDQVICSFINTLAFMEAKDFNDFMEFWNNQDDAICSIITIFHLFFSIYLPFFCLKLMHDTYQRELREDEPKSAWLDILKENIRQNDYYARMNTVMFLFRRLFASTLLIVSHRYPFFQSTVLMLVSTFNFAFLYMYNPSLSKQANRVELFNETAILFCSYCYTLLLNQAYQDYSIILVGNFFVFFAGFNIFGNLCVTIFQSFGQMGQSLVANYYIIKHEAILNERLFRRRYLIESAPGEFKQFEKEMELYDGVKYCQRWLPQLKWLKSNHCDFGSLEEHKKYIEIQNHFNLRESINKYLYSKGIQLGAKVLLRQDQEKERQIKLEKNIERLRISYNTKAKYTRNLDLKEIREDSKESQESERQILSKKKQEITSLGMLSGFVPQNGYFQINHKKAKKDLAKASVREKAENDTLFREILNDEIRGYNDKGKETEQLRNENQIFEKSISLDFMTSENLQIGVNKLLVKQVQQTIEEKLSEIPDENGLVPLVNGGSNNGVHSVIQCLANCGSFLRFIIGEKYNNFTAEDGYSKVKQFSQQINIVFSGIYSYRDDDVVGVFNDFFDMKPLGKLIRDKMQNEKTKNKDPEKVLEMLLHTVVLETVPLDLIKEMSSPQRTNDTIEKFYYSSVINKMFRFLLKKKQKCKNGHYVQSLTTTLGLHLNSPDQTMPVAEMIEIYFNPKYAHFVCQLCKDKTPQMGVEQFVIQSLPQYLVIYFDTYDQFYELDIPRERIPKILLFNQLFKKRDRVPDDSSYRLISTISTPKAKITKVQYTTLCEKKLGGKVSRRWFKFKDNLIVPELGKNVRTKYPAQMAIYEIGKFN